MIGQDLPIIRNLGLKFLQNRALIFNIQILNLNQMSNLMSESQNKIFQKYQNLSLMTMSISNQAEPTKKTIQAEQLLNFQPIALSNNRKYVFSLPFSTQIASLVMHLTTRFSSRIIHSEEEGKGAQIILEGLKMPGIRRVFAKILDYCVFCCSRGLKFGNLQETYNVILINIRRQVIENKVTIAVTNPYHRQEIQPLFISTILDPIQDQLKTLSKLQMSSEDTNFTNPYLDESSPTQLYINIHKKIYNIFILSEMKEFNRYKTIFMDSKDKLSKEMEQHKSKLKLTANNKKNLPSPAALIELFNNQTFILMQFLRNSYKQEQTPWSSYLNSLVTSQVAQQIAFYTIEETLCLYELNNLKEIYYLHTSEQCQAYNNQMDYLNKKCTDTECFDHLQLKTKYRLPKQFKPYYSAIQRLKTIQTCISLREMLLVIQQTFSEVKTDCLISHKGKVELSSMDQLLPVMIFVTVRAGIRNFPVLVKIIDDYVRSKNVFQLEERVITTLYVAIEDISRSSGWQQKMKK